MAVYIPPQANMVLALNDPYNTISNLENVCPESSSIGVGDFNQASLRKIRHKYYQHMNVNTQENSLLDHCYSPFCNASKALLHSLFGKSFQPIGRG